MCVSAPQRSLLCKSLRRPGDDIPARSLSEHHITHYPPSVPVTTFPWRTMPAPPPPPLMLRKPLILSLECLYPLNSVATTSDCQLHTRSNYKWLEKKTFCSPQQNSDSAAPMCPHIIKSLFSFSCLVLLCVSACACCCVFTQSVSRDDSGRIASSGVNVRTAASATDRLVSAAAAAAGWERTVRKASLYRMTEAKRMNLQKHWPHGKCCTVETELLAFLVNYNL